MNSMTEPVYPESAEHIASTLREFYRLRKRPQLLEVVENAVFRVDNPRYDNWDGGLYRWSLRLEVPIVVYAALGERRSEVEQTLLQDVDFLDRQYPQNLIREVTIAPLSPGKVANGQTMLPAAVDVQRIWNDRPYRLFLSHVSADKAFVDFVKHELSIRCIAAFIAHEDIVPSLEWQDELSLALRSMHALAALVTPEFHASQWTDQEVGWALGRGVPVFPVCLNATPYGLMGRFQGLPGKTSDPATVADELVKASLRNSQTRSQTRLALVEALERAARFDDAQAIGELLRPDDQYLTHEIDRILQASETNYQVRGARGLKAALESKFSDSDDSATIDL
jgi:TIR domain